MLSGVINNRGAVYFDALVCMCVCVCVRRDSFVLQRAGENKIAWQQKVFKQSSVCIIILALTLISVCVCVCVCEGPSQAMPYVCAI